MCCKSKRKNWEEKMKKKCCIKNALFGFSCIASCSKGRAYPLQLPAVSFALANLYSIDFFFKKETTLLINWILKREKRQHKQLKINTKSNFSIYKHISSSDRTTNLKKQSLSNSYPA